MDDDSLLAFGKKQYTKYRFVNKNTIASRDCLAKGWCKFFIEENYWRSCALSLAHQQDYNQAIALLNQLIDCHPQNAVDYNNRGLVYFQSGDLEKAFHDYNTALYINPDLASAYNNRANCYAACGQLQIALSDYDKALDLDPRNVRAWINRGITLRDLCRYSEAIEDFEMALLFGQLKSHIWAGRGRTYHLWGDWNYAIADYERALAQITLVIDPPNTHSYRLLIQVEKWLEELLNPQP